MVVCVLNTYRRWIMNKFLLLVVVLSLILLGGCSTDEQKEEVNPSQDENNSEKSNAHNNEQSAENSREQTEADTYGGDFNVVAHKEDIDKVKVGPLTITIVVSNLVTGTITDSFALKEVGKENIDYINIGMKIDTTDEDINFSSEHLKLSTNTGERFETPHEYLSDQVEMQYIKEIYTRTRMISYLFDDSKVEEVESAVLLIKAPTDENGQPLGEDAKINIDFKRD